MSLSRQDLRTFVRTHIDVDPDELPDVVLDFFLNEGFRRIALDQVRWPFYQKTYTLSTTAGTGSYTLASIDPNLQEVDAVFANDHALKYVDRHRAETNWFSQSETASPPQFFSVWGGSIRLWPKPDAIYALTVVGYKRPTFDAGAGAIPDLPDDFHELVGLWALSRSYMQQDDPDVAQIYMQNFEGQLAQIRQYYLHMPVAGPLVMNSEKLTWNLPPRLRFPFEV